MENSEQTKQGETAPKKSWWKSWQVILAVVVVVLLLIVFFFFSKENMFASKYTDDEKEVSNLVREVNKFFADV